MTTSNAPGSLGETIRRRRTELGWSQEELAMRASGDGDEVRQSDISRLERGRVGLPRRARLLRIAAALDLAPGDLLARSGWAGAYPKPATPLAAPEPGPSPPVGTVRPVPAADPWARGADASQTAQRLRRAIDDAAQTRARTEQVLRRSDELFGLAAAPLERRPRPGSAASGEPARPLGDGDEPGSAAPETAGRAPSDR